RSEGHTGNTGAASPRRCMGRPPRRGGNRAAGPVVPPALDQSLVIGVKDAAEIAFRARSNPILRALSARVLRRRVPREVEERQEELGLLRARDRVAAVDDEAGDARDAEPACAVVLR